MRTSPQTTGHPQTVSQRSAGAALAQVSDHIHYQQIPASQFYCRVFNAPYRQGLISERVQCAGPPPNTVNADGEPIYDPLKDLELATAKVCPVMLH